MPTKRYFIFSWLIHIALFSTVLFYAFNPELLPQVVEPKKDVISISVEGHSGTPSITPLTTAPNLTEKKVPAASAAHPAEPAEVTSIDDIVIPPLAELPPDDSVETTSQALPNFEEITSRLNEADTSDSATLVAANEELSHLASKNLESIDEKLSQIQDQNDKLDTRAEQQRQDLRVKRQQIESSHEAPKEATISTAGLEKLSNAGTEELNTAQSEDNGVAAATAGMGVGNNPYGTGTGTVRQLEDLRQMPGNKKPEYDLDDRLKGLSGAIVLYGFVSKEGLITQFKMVQSTGHRSLDKKTLLALKKWKFYPGQEGWVELPFKWDLKGGVQQKPTLLKRK